MMAHVADVDGFESDGGNETNSDFQSACDVVTSLAGSLSQQRLLQLYGLYKQATEGPCSAPKPGFLDFRGKEKWNAWNSLKTMPKEEAADRYVALVDEIKPDWRKDKCPRSSSGFGMRASILAHEDEAVIPDAQKTIFDWVKEGNTAEVQRKINVSGFNQNVRDDDGQGLLHWACDRGHLNLVEFLVLNGGCDVNIRDRDGSTPLHYAATIGNAEVVELLLTKLGADPSIKDEEGLTALDAADSKTVKDLISEALKSVS